MYLLADRKLPNRSGKDKTVLRMRTVSQLTEALDIAIARASGKAPECSARRDNKSGFAGTATPEIYRDMLRNGWPEGVSGVQGLEGLSTDTAQRLTFVRSVGGAFPNVPAFLQGDPQAMYAPVHAPVDHVRGLTLVINNSFSATVSAETVLTYARQVMKLVSWLQAEGIESAIYSAIRVRLSEGVQALYLTPIREAGDVMQPERIASLVHPSFLRRAYFAMLEYEHRELKLPGAGASKGGYGTASVATAEELRNALPDAFSIVRLPPIGSGDPMLALQESDTFKLRTE